MRIIAPTMVLIILFCVVILSFGDGDREIAQDQEMVKAIGYWIYNDLEKGIAQAEKTGQPMLVVFR